MGRTSDLWDLYWIAEILVELYTEKSIMFDDFQNLYNDLFE